MEYRHEVKHVITAADLHILRNRLKWVMALDPHGDENGCYLIRSLYFDTPNDRALREKLDGVGMREKFRIRCYNGEDSLIRLEKKSKIGNLSNKQSACLTPELTRSILEGNLQPMRKSNRPLILELYAKMQGQLLRPKTIVQYRREAWLYPPGNVRVTFDTQLKTGLYHQDLLNPEAPMITPLEPVMLLEVKYDAFLPEIIAKLLQLGDRSASAFSKYAQCRIYG